MSSKIGSRIINDSLKLFLKPGSRGKICSSFSKEELIGFAKELNVSYKGTKPEICDNIKKALNSGKYFQDEYIAHNFPLPSSKSKSGSGSRSSKIVKSEIINDKFRLYLKKGSTGKICTSFLKEELIEFAKELNVSYKGTKPEICDNIKKALKDGHF